MFPRVTLAAVLFIACAVRSADALPAYGSGFVISVPDQELAVLSRGKIVTRFPVSTSKFGTGDGVGTYRTPLGTFFISAKIGDHLPAGAVIKRRAATGEVVAVNSVGRDAIVSRVIWLRGKDATNRNAFDRCIYIHGTTEEKRIGRRASFGCVRMKSKDVIALYQLAHIGTSVLITEEPLTKFLPAEEPTLLSRAD